MWTNTVNFLTYIVQIYKWAVIYIITKIIFYFTPDAEIAAGVFESENISQPTCASANARSNINLQIKI